MNGVYHARQWTLDPTGALLPLKQYFSTGASPCDRRSLARSAPSGSSIRDQGSLRIAGTRPFTGSEARSTGPRTVCIATGRRQQFRLRNRNVEDYVIVPLQAGHVRDRAPVAGLSPCPYICQLNHRHSRDFHVDGRIGKCAIPNRKPRPRLESVLSLKPAHKIGRLS